MLSMIYMAVYAVMIFTMLLILYWFYKCKSKPKYNSLLWVHPNKGGGIIDIYKEPDKLKPQKPFLFNYRWYEFNLPMFRKPLYFWYEQDPVTETREQDGKNITIKKYPIAHWEPEKPADFGLVTIVDAEGKETIDRDKSYITPNELFDNTDWECLRELETAKKPWQETVKVGVAIAMVALCLFGIIVAMDMIGKNKQTNVERPAIQQNIGVSKSW